MAYTESFYQVCYAYTRLAPPPSSGRLREGLIDFLMERAHTLIAQKAAKDINKVVPARKLALQISSGEGGLPSQPPSRPINEAPGLPEVRPRALRLRGSTSLGLTRPYAPVGMTSQQRLMDGRCEFSLRALDTAATEESSLGRHTRRRGPGGRGSGAWSVDVTTVGDIEAPEKDETQERRGNWRTYVSFFAKKEECASGSHFLLIINFTQQLSITIIDK